MLSPPNPSPTPDNDNDNDDNEHPLNLFDDPKDYYPPSPPPTVQSYTTQSGTPIALHLVGHSPLEAHHLWNGSRVVATHFETNPSLVTNRTLLELGAGAGLPSLVAAALGALKVVVTDFPDPDLVANMWRNIDECTLIPKDGSNRIVAEGYVWGMDPTKVLGYLGGEGERFDVLVLADLLFRHSEHGRLLDSIEMMMDKKGVAFVVFTSYRPWLQHKDLNFFELARERGFRVNKILEKKMERPLFENDPGDEEVRKTVTGWEVRWPEDGVLKKKQGEEVEGKGE